LPDTIDGGRFEELQGNRQGFLPIRFPPARVTASGMDLPRTKRIGRCRFQVQAEDSSQPVYKQNKRCYADTIAERVASQWTQSVSFIPHHLLSSDL
jgi:hypothetical protein